MSIFYFLRARGTTESGIRGQQAINTQTSLSYQKINICATSAYIRLLCLRSLSITGPEELQKSEMGKNKLHPFPLLRRFAPHGSLWCSVPWSTLLSSVLKTMVQPVQFQRSPGNKVYGFPVATIPWPSGSLWSDVRGVVKWRLISISHQENIFWKLSNCT